MQLEFLLVMQRVLKPMLLIAVRVLGNLHLCVLWMVSGAELSKVVTALVVQVARTQVLLWSP